MDVLTALANGLNLRAKLTYAGGVCGKWLMDHNSDQAIWFHLLTKGQGWVHSAAWNTPQAVEDGDLLVFLPHAAKHVLSYSSKHISNDPDGMRTASWDEAETGFVCGIINLGVAKSFLWQALPGEIVIKRTEAGDILARLIELIIRESASPRFGSESVVERLCDSIFVLVARHCIEANLVRQGIFAALQDQRLATVLGLIHEEPWHLWTIAELCSRGGISKTLLAEKFASLIGASPIEYLTNWRFQLAASWLRDTSMSIERVAEQCGYDSAASFSKAFKRSFGVPPGAFRRGINGAVTL